MRRTAIERYAAEYGIAVVMPNVSRSWYTDRADGARYFNFVTKELPDVCRGYFRGMSDKREDNIVAGLSMGGYGAIKAALSCPERFGMCASLSGALDISTFPANIDEWKTVFGYELSDISELRGTKHDVYELARKNHKSNVPFPKMYMWCGTSDSLIESSRKFSGLLSEFGVEHCYEESEGNHSWKWWDLHIQSALEYLLEKK